MPCIRLDRSYALISTSAGVVLRSDLGTVVLTGPDAGVFLGRIAPLLDGSRDRAAILAELGDYAEGSVAALLDRLEARGVIEAVPSGDDGRRRPQEALLRRWLRAPEEANRRLLDARVLVAGLTPWGATASVELAAAGVGAVHLLDEDGARREEVAAAVRARAPTCRVEHGPMSTLEGGGLAEPAHLLVAAVRVEDGAQVERVARFAHRAQVASLWSHLAGSRAFVGPLVTPGQTACRICAAAEPLNPPLGRGAEAAPAHRARAMELLLGHLVAMEALKVISGYTFSELGGRLVVRDLAGHGSSLHTLVRIPWCRVCGRSKSGPAPMLP